MSATFRGELRAMSSTPSDVIEGAVQLSIDVQLCLMERAIVAIRKLPGSEDRLAVMRARDNLNFGLEPGTRLPEWL